MTHRSPGAAVNVPPGPGEDRRGQGEQRIVDERISHGGHRNRHREDAGDDAHGGPRRQRAGLARLHVRSAGRCEHVFARLRQLGVVPGGSDCIDKALGRDRRRIVAHRRAPRHQVDGGISHPGLGGQCALHSCLAGGAGHSCHRKNDLFVCLCLSGIDLSRHANLRLKSIYPPPLCQAADATSANHAIESKRVGHVEAEMPPFLVIIHEPFLLHRGL